MASPGQGSEQSRQAHDIRLLVDTIPTMAWSARPNGSAEFLNRRWLDYTGLSAEEASDWGWAAALHAEDRDRLMDFWRHLLDSGEAGEIEARLRRYDGDYRWFLFRVEPARDNRGDIFKWYGANTDIEDRKRAEALFAAEKRTLEMIAIEGERSQEALRSASEEIRNSEARLLKIIDTIPTHAWCTLPDGTGIFWNRRWLEYTGLSLEVLRGWGWQNAIHPEDLKKITDKWRRDLAAGQPGEVEGRLRRFDGVYRWFLFRAEPLRDESGNIVNWYGTDTDIDDLKRAEARLRQDEEELRRMTDAIPQTIIVMNPDGKAIYANRVTLEYTGLSLDDVRGDDFRARVFHPDDVQRLREERNKALSGAAPFENEQRALGKDGKYRWFLIRYNPLLDESGNVIRWYATGTDIDDRKRAEDPPAKRNRRVARAN